MCHECFLDKAENGSDEEIKDVHVDFPTENFIEETADRMVNEMVDEMFGAGAYIALSNVLKLQHRIGMKEEKDSK